MTIKRIFDHFDSKTKLWISVNEVKSQIISNGCADEITFHFVDIDEAIVRGFLVRSGTAGGVYAESEFRSDIYIAKSLNDDWKRVVAVKELLHIVDTDEFTAESHEAVRSLLENMAIPQEVREYKASYLNDRIRLISAISILVPRTCRVKLRGLCESGAVTHSEIALMAKIPERFVPFLMSEEFEEQFNEIHELVDGPA